MNNKGFTLIEIVFVIIIIGIIFGTVGFTRSFNYSNLYLRGDVDMIHSYIKYTQSMAMKKNQVWGVKNASGYFWMFEYKEIGDQNNPIRFPDQSQNKIDTSHIPLPAFTLFFDQIGSPYITSVSQNAKLKKPFDIDISNYTLRIIPETGFIKKIKG